MQKNELLRNNKSIVRILEMTNNAVLAIDCINKTMPQIIDWLYEHSDGITSVVVSLIHDAQELAISTGYEKLDLNSLNQAYEERLQLLHGYIRPQNIVQPKPKKKEPQIIIFKPSKADESCSILDLAKRSKEERLDFIKLLSSAV